MVIRIIEDLDGEEWRQVEEYPEYYVSNYGRFKSYKCRCGAKNPSWKLHKLKPHKKHGYIQPEIYGKNKRLHRLIAKAFLPNEDNLPEVDHIDGNPSNNHIDNLRWVNIQQNNINTKKRKDNKSGFRGVYWYKATKKWRAYIRINSKPIHGGSFDNIEDAIKKRLELEDLYWDPEFNPRYCRTQ